MIGIIRSVTGGRVLVDFNHPLAGKELVYDLKVIKKIEDTGDKLVALLKYGMAINKKMYEYKLNKEVLKLKLKLKLPDPFKSKISEKIKGTIPEITKIEFSEETTNKGKK